MKPVDKPDDEPILVNMDWIFTCPAEVPDSLWLGYGGMATMIHPNINTSIHSLLLPQQDQHSTRYKDSMHQVVQGRPTD